MKPVLVLHYRKVAVFIEKLGLVNSGDITLESLQKWLQRNRIDYSLSGLEAGNIQAWPHATPMTENYVAFILSNGE